MQARWGDYRDPEIGLAIRALVAALFRRAVLEPVIKWWQLPANRRRNVDAGRHLTEELPPVSPVRVRQRSEPPEPCPLKGTRLPPLVATPRPPSAGEIVARVML